MESNDKYTKVEGGTRSRVSAIVALVAMMALTVLAMKYTCVVDSDREAIATVSAEATVDMLHKEYPEVLPALDSVVAALDAAVQAREGDPLALARKVRLAVALTELPDTAEVAGQMLASMAVSWVNRTYKVSSGEEDFLHNIGILVAKLREAMSRYDESVDSAA